VKKSKKSHKMDRIDLKQEKVDDCDSCKFIIHVMITLKKLVNHKNIEIAVMRCENECIHNTVKLI
jgi:hypothetical protein